MDFTDSFEFPVSLSWASVVQSKVNPNGLITQAYTHLPYKGSLVGQTFEGLIWQMASLQASAFIAFIC